MAGDEGAICPMEKALGLESTDLVEGRYEPWGQREAEIVLKVYLLRNLLG